MVATSPTTTLTETNERVSPLERARAFAVPAALLGIMMLAALLRFTGQNWDEARTFTRTSASSPWWRPQSNGRRVPASTSIPATNTLNPYNFEYPTFIYGTFPLYAAKLYGQLTGHTVYGNFHLASRSVSAIFDLLTIFFLFLIGRRLFNERIGLAGVVALCAVGASHPVVAFRHVRPDRFGALCDGVLFRDARGCEREVVGVLFSGVDGRVSAGKQAKRVADCGRAGDPVDRAVADQWPGCILEPQGTHGRAGAAGFPSGRPDRFLDLPHRAGDGIFRPRACSISRSIRNGLPTSTTGATSRAANTTAIHPPSGPIAPQSFSS